MNKNPVIENDAQQLKDQLEEARAEAAYYKDLARQAGIQRLKDIDHLSSVINLIRKTDKALKDNRDLLDAILEFSPAIFHIKDLEGKYTLVNRRCEELLNLDSSRIIGKHPGDLFPKETADAFAESEKTSCIIRSGAPRNQVECPQSSKCQPWLTNHFKPGFKKLKTNGVQARIEALFSQSRHAVHHGMVFAFTENNKNPKSK